MMIHGGTYLILRIKEMHVAGGDHQLVECLAQLYNPPVDITMQLLDRVDGALLIPQHELLLPIG